MQWQKKSWHVPLPATREGEAGRGTPGVGGKAGGLQVTVGAGSGASVDTVQRTIALQVALVLLGSAVVPLHNSRRAKRVRLLALPRVHAAQRPQP